MSLNLDTLRAETHHEPFRFVLDGEEREIPHVRDLSTEQALALDGGEVAKVLPDIAGADVAGRLLKLPVHAMEKFMTEWLSHAGLQPGESPASSSS